MERKYIIIGVLLLVGVGVFFLVQRNDATDTENKTAQKSDVPSLSVPKQLVLKSVRIDRVNLAKPGYVVIRGMADGKLSQILEVSPLLPAGASSDITIDLLEAPPDNVSVIAVAYEDDGDGGFNPTFDARVVVDEQILAVNVETGTKIPNDVFLPEGVAGAQKDAAVTITYTDQGYTPATVTIQKGQTVSFVNNSSVPMWTASNPHPAHTILPTFDQFKGSEPGSVYQYTFDQVGTWRYHDHINPSFGGVVIVTEAEGDPTDEEDIWSVSAVPQLEKNADGYMPTDPDTFATLANNPDVTMVNVHIPYEGQIAGTDLSVPYNKTEELLASLPKDKNAPVAVYCRSGGMSAVAARALVAAGYTNVYDLSGGMIAFEKSGNTLIR